jgi:hypothetical protein
LDDHPVTALRLVAGLRVDAGGQRPSDRTSSFSATAAVVATYVDAISFGSTLSAGA